MEWNIISKRWENSVIQLIVTVAQFNPLRPYATPDTPIFKGTGFIIDIINGIVVTNAHVLENAIAITGRIKRFGRRQLSLKFLSICSDRDVALCQLDSSDISLIMSDLKSPADVNMILGNDLNHVITDELLTMGYPLGEEDIKYSTGIISGYRSDNNDGFINNEDVHTRLTSLIQITAPVNPGNSGGPALNKNGEIIGIVSGGYDPSHEIGYMIGITSFIGVYSSLLTNKIVNCPTFNINWCNTNDELLSYYLDDPTLSGIYIRDVGPDSCLKSLITGDILTQISFNDNDASIDRYGEVILSNNNNLILSRKLSLSQLADIIPLNSPLVLDFYRDKKLHKFKTSYTFIPTTRLLKYYPTITHYQYLIFAGMCCCQTTLNIYNEDSDAQYYQNNVMIVEVFNGTTLFKTQVFRERDIIKFINSQPITSISDIRSLLLSKPSYLIIEVMNNSITILSLQNIIEQDLNIYKRLNLDYSHYPLKF